MPKLGFVFSGPFSWRERAQSVRDLRSDSKSVYDLAVIGGGITGAAIARDAALRGLKVLLIEKDDFASGTSSRSSKLVHGGVRYLEQYEFRLVMESTRERAFLWKLAPHLVSPMPFLFPAYKGGRVPLWKLNAGLWLYDFLAMFRTPSLHRRYSAAKTLEVEPKLKKEGLTGSIFYWDGATNDALLTLSNIADATLNGALCLPRMRLKSVEWHPGSAESAAQAHALHLTDELTQGELMVRARVVVSAAGPWTDALLKTLDKSPAHPLLATTRGSHIVVPRVRLPAEHAVVIFHPKDGRVLFSIPWGDCTILGTTDIFDGGSPDSTQITGDEISYLIDAGNDYFPDCHLRWEDVISTWTGLRPLLAPPQEASASQVSREHHLEFQNPGLLVIAGGKLTTHREMANEAVDKILHETGQWATPLLPSFRPACTRERPLPSFINENQKAQYETGEKIKLSIEDLVHICRTQMPLSIEDIFVRRTSLFYKEVENGWGLLTFFKDTLCRELQWTEEDWKRQVIAYRQYLEKHVLNPLKRELPPLPF